MLVDRNKIIKQINQVNTPVVIISGEVEKKWISWPQVSGNISKLPEWLMETLHLDARLTL